MGRRASCCKRSEAQAVFALHEIFERKQQAHRHGESALECCAEAATRSDGHSVAPDASASSVSDRPRGTLVEELCKTGQQFRKVKWVAKKPSAPGHPEEPWRRRTCFSADFGESRFFAALRMTAFRVSFARSWPSASRGSRFGVLAFFAVPVNANPNSLFPMNRRHYRRLRFPNGFTAGG